MLRYRTLLSRFSIYVSRWFVVLFNVVIFLFALHALSCYMEESVEIDVITDDPYEALLPGFTLTNEMKVGMFFEGLRIDTSVIKPKEIERSLNPWAPYIRHYSKRYGVDPDLVRAIIYAESKGNPYSISKDGALGLMQIMPSTADFLGISNMLDPEENINAGVKYIAWLVKHYGETNVLWAWNAGPSNFRNNFMPGETKKFIVEVLSIKTYLKDDKNKTI